VLREAYLPHYRTQVLARAQSAALTMRPFAERLVHFWTNHFAISADKGTIFGLAGTLENEAVRPHVNGRFVDLLMAAERHPSTARFIATKLTRHFVADEPPAATVDRVTRAFLKSDGDLPQVYSALIDSPEAWDATRRKFKTPEDLVFSTLRAFDASPTKPDEVIRGFDFLGQRQYTPGSPAGWPDIAKAWDGPDALMHRVLWASRVAERYDQGVSPLDVAATALGGYARAETLTALRRAASGAQALALLLMSPEFQRRAKPSKASCWGTTVMACLHRNP
jgi:uncharacterized protein (DUF1800 family)